MKITTLEELPVQWPEILRWVNAGEEVRITDRDRTVARVLPPLPATPDFVGRAEAIWGALPEGEPLSVLVQEGRGPK